MSILFAGLSRRMYQCLTVLTCVKHEYGTMVYDLNPSVNLNSVQGVQPRAFRLEKISAERITQMSQTTRENLQHILGELDDNTCAAIQATGADIKDVTEAKAIADGKSDIVGQGEQAIPGPVKEVLIILRQTK